MNPATGSRYGPIATARSPYRTTPRPSGPTQTDENNGKPYAADTQIENDHNPFSFEYVNLA
jgi:hypothetical protein